MPPLRSTACLLLLGAALAARAQAPPELPLQLDVDYAAFHYDEEASLFEAYLAFGAGSLPYEREGGRFVAALPVRVALRHAAAAGPEAASEALVHADTLEYLLSVPDTSGLSGGQFFIQQLRAAVPPGEYELEVVVEGDEAAGRPELAVRRDVAVPDFAAAREEGRPMVSDLLLASALTPSQEAASPFYKSGLEVQPNPNGLFGAGLPRLFYYAEAYGLEEAGAPYTLFAYVAPANLPQPLAGLQQRTERAARDPDVLVGSFDISALPSGSYYLRLALLDAENEALAEQARKFFVYNPEVAAPLAAAAERSYDDDLYAAMPEEELEENLRHAELLATGRERQQMRRLASEQQKREFLAAFWRRRDERPETPVNETRRDFYERIHYANERYSTSYAEGWDTPRGRVVVKYGYPSAVDPRRSSSNLVPHEIWEYDHIPGTGRAIFVFADRTGFGEYDLLHSNVAGETSLPEWQERLRR